MTYYKLEPVQLVLRAHGARGGTVAGQPFTEHWEREVHGVRYRTALAWGNGDGLLAEVQVRALLATLFVQPLIEEIERRGGLWL